MPQPNDLSRSLVALEQDITLIAVIEMSQSSWLVAGIVPGIERHPLKKLEPDEAALLRLLWRWRDEAAQKGRTIMRIVVAFEAGRDGFWLARWLRARGVGAPARRSPDSASDVGRYPTVTRRDAQQRPGNRNPRHTRITVAAKVLTVADARHGSAQRCFSLVGGFFWLLLLCGGGLAAAKRSRQDINRMAPSLPPSIPSVFDQ